MAWDCKVPLPYLFLGTEQLLPGEALELHMAHMALLEPGNHARGQHCSRAAGLVPPLIVLDVQHQTEHDVSTLAHLPFRTCLCCPGMDCHHEVLYIQSAGDAPFMVSRKTSLTCTEDVFLVIKALNRQP